MKKFICGLLFSLSILTSGQKISFNLQILSSTDSEIIAVRDYWQTYLNDYVNNHLTKTENISKKYWNDIELEQGFTDIANDEFSFVSVGELLTFDITKEENGFYRIRCMVMIITSSINNVFSIYDIYIKKQDSGYKLYNHFFFIKPKLQSFQAGRINFYYPSNYNFSIEKAKQMADDYSKFSIIYGNTENRKVTYIIGNTFAEANSYIGFDFSILSSGYPKAGYYLTQQNIILSHREDHLHEIIHAVIDPMYCDKSLLFREGIATFYGGSVGLNYSKLIDQLKDLVKKDPNIDLSKFDDFDKILDNGSNHFYTIGAIFIDYALKNDGPQKVIKLFQYSGLNYNTSEGAKSAIEQELGIKKDQINSFLKMYIQNFNNW